MKESIVLLSFNDKITIENNDNKSNYSYDSHYSITIITVVHLFNDEKNQTDDFHNLIGICRLIKLHISTTYFIVN